MRIGLIRHGQTDWNSIGKIQGQTDIPLNDMGRTQAKLLAERLVGNVATYSWDYVVSSGLMRAEETAAIIADALEVPQLTADSRLIERYYGLVEGTTQAERVARWGEQWKLQDLCQESDEQVRTRGISFLSDLLIAYPSANILVVSHGSFLAQLYQAIFPGHVQDTISNLSFTVLEYEQPNWKSLLYNCTQHLERSSV